MSAPAIRSCRPGRGAAACLALLAALPAARAARLEARVVDAKGRPLADAVVSANPSGTSPSAVAAAQAAIDQVNEEFVPHVTALRVGTAVIFPNRDDIRHHVYSFSAAKRFELPLYKGTPAVPVVFDRPGEVVLGCNIHDWMVAYVYVLETPYFATTSPDGLASLELPPGNYEVEVRHPRSRRSPEELRQMVQVSDGTGEPLRFSLDLKPEFRRPRGPRPGPRDYR